MVRRGMRLLAELIAIPAGLAASLGLIDALRSLPGPSLALTLPLRETGHADHAPVAVVIIVFGLVFGLTSLALRPKRDHPVRMALVRTAGLLGCALAVQALSLQLVRQASFGFDWSGALRSPAPFVCALGAFAGVATAGWVTSSDRRRRRVRRERSVESGSPALPAVKVGR